MPTLRFGALPTLLCALFLLSFALPVRADALDNLAACKDRAFSTEEDFLAGVDTVDGNPLVSDGDLLSPDGQVCARNHELLRPWEVQADLGLDAVDMVAVDKKLVAFSTELDDPEARFTAGDVLATNGVVIPNEALLRSFQVSRNLGLDGLQFVGDPRLIALFLDAATQFSREDWITKALLPEWLARYEIDIWFSTEGTERRAAAVPIYDGDILSARHGVIVLSQHDLMVAGVPAGIPERGIDFGVDAIAARRKPERSSVRFSTEILYRKDAAFDDGDILKVASGVETDHYDFIAAFEPAAKFLGVDALFMTFADDVFGPDGPGGNNPNTTNSDLYLPLVQGEQN